MSPALRISSCTTEPWSISNQRERVDLPMMIWVDVVLPRIGQHIVGDALAPGKVMVSAPSFSASRRVSATRSRSASLSR